MFFSFRKSLTFMLYFQIFSFMQMKDATCLNFGALTNEELDFMLEHNNDITLLVPVTPISPITVP